MPKKPADRILSACHKAKAEGFRIVADCCGLDLQGGIYGPADPKRRVCLPLEAVLLGKRSRGGFEADVARALRVSWEWVSGFLDGFALREGVKADREGYQEGGGLPQET